MGPLPLDPGWRIALACLAWLAGIGLQLQQPELWPAWVDAASVGLAAILVASAWRLRGGLALAMLLLAAALAAAGTTGWRAQHRLAESLDPALEGVDLVLTGVVAGLPQVGPAGTRFVFEVESAERARRSRDELAPLRVPSRVALGWYRNDRDEAWLGDPAGELRAGQRWQLPVRLKRPHGAMNPHGFDVELWWWEQGLRATGYVRVVAGWSQARLLDAAAGHPVDRLRQRLRDDISHQVSEPRWAGVVAALLVGDQAAIERDDWDLFRATGIAHLMSISGVHVTMFAWLAGLVVGPLWRRSGRAMLAVPAPVAARWAGLLAAAGYALLAGWGVPAERTVWMLAAVVALRTLGVRWPWPLVLLSAAVAVTLRDPWALLQAGFWLSFAAVGLLIVSEDREAARTRPPPGRWTGALRRHLRAQAAATVGLAPLSLVFFQQVSLVGLAANLIAIPLVTLVVTPLAVAGTLVAPLWTAAAWAVQALAGGLEALAAWPLAVWTTAAAPPWMAAAALVGAVFAVLPLPGRLRLVALPLMLPLLAPPVERPADGRFELVAADIGQGNSVLVRTRAHLLVYDTGPQYSRESDAGQRVLLPLLRARGETHIDRLVLSHRDSDHVGGAASLLAGLPVTDIVSSLEPSHPLLAGREHLRCEDGQSWRWDGVHFEILHPAAGDHAVARKPNVLSCVLRVVDAAGRSVLLAGDIEKAQEDALVGRHGAALASTALLVPHHGSRSSSGEAFVDTVSPRVAFVQAAYRSRFGHPAPEVVERYRERGAEVVRSDRCGAWSWRDGLASCARDARRRYWHWPAAQSATDISASR